jgi:hypothetical protein
MPDPVVAGWPGEAGKSPDPWSIMFGITPGQDLSTVKFPVVGWGWGSIGSFGPGGYRTGQWRPSSAGYSPGPPQNMSVQNQFASQQKAFQNMLPRSKTGVGNG